MNEINIAIPAHEGPNTFKSVPVHLGVVERYFYQARGIFRYSDQLFYEAYMKRQDGDKTVIVPELLDEIDFFSGLDNLTMRMSRINSQYFYYSEPSRDPLEHIISDSVIPIRPPFISEPIRRRRPPFIGHKKSRFTITEDLTGLHEPITSQSTLTDLFYIIDDDGPTKADKYKIVKADRSIISQFNEARGVFRYITEKNKHDADKGIENIPINEVAFNGVFAFNCRIHRTKYLNIFYYIDLYNVGHVISDELKNVKEVLDAHITFPVNDEKYMIPPMQQFDPLVALPTTVILKIHENDKRNFFDSPNRYIQFPLEEEHKEEVWVAIPTGKGTRRVVKANSLISRSFWQADKQFQDNEELSKTEKYNFIVFKYPDGLYRVRKDPLIKGRRPLYFINEKNEEFLMDDNEERINKAITYSNSEPALELVRTPPYLPPGHVPGQELPNYYIPPYQDIPVRDFDPHRALNPPPYNNKKPPSYLYKPHPHDDPSHPHYIPSFPGDKPRREEGEEPYCAIS